MITTGIVGGSGYTGAELIRLLLQHPEIDLRTITSRSNAGERVDQSIDSLRGATDLVFTDPEKDHLSECDLVFFATPPRRRHAASATIIKGQN